VRPSRRLQRIVLLAFVVTFACTRLLVLLIMARKLPDLYVHIGGTHVHHLNFGIVVLAVVGAALLFAQPHGRWRDVVAAGYGIGLALTFDEFGMWLHLGGSYWQRASFDAITVVGGLLLLAAWVPPPRAWTRRGIAIAGGMLALLAVFFWRLSLSWSPIEQRALPALERIEQQGPR
jgi:hypothetical protein